MTQTNKPPEWWKKELKSVNGYKFASPASQKEIASFISQTLLTEREMINSNIGMLRQWLNEKPDDRLVTNEDIKHWLKLLE